jgi:hypothetical protein
MSTYVNDSSSSGFLGILIGLLIAAALAVGAYFLFTGGTTSSTNIDKHVTIEAPKLQTPTPPAQAPVAPAQPGQ